ncbi:CCR4-NOT transcription complex subunit 6 [Acrasis kona]|uniref:CCR4-NOT transcription complex subunit 6 n=1 Tax=Acrasis kona TaxID=1008807 RepID=A0AAW2ZFN3_9EUKA
MKSLGRQVNGTKVSVMSYNLLAKMYAEHRFFPHSDPIHLDWDAFRSKKFEQTFTRYKPDILCFQEIQEDDFQQWLCPFMKNIGYSGKMFRKKRDLADDVALDGCATFYKHDKFEFINEHRLDYSEYARRMKTTFKDDTALGQFALPTHNVGLFLHLNNKDIGDFWVVNTHLNWNKNHPHLQLYQIKALMAELSRNINKMPFVICGDFNSLPTSAVYEYLHNGFIDSKSNNYGSLLDVYSGLFASSDVTMKYMESKHGIQSIKCAYDDKSTFTLPFTTRVHEKFEGVIDYIWYSSDSLTPVALLNDLTPEEIQNKELSLPNENHPSDHVPIMAEFQYKTSE